ncbi:N-acetyl sugar amidotransferase [Pontibacter kalidii]|uniref:N-acetyl sugar amidotransferase n=1 Tax=Pontibacter kalidii TaxID=2592049 RepID=UPI0022536C64|nr:N-acetyl sugar amidotransferase [Pontibacter kalidii]
MKREVVTCVKCLMDSTDPDIHFNSGGICNYCLEAEETLPKYRYTDEQIGANIGRLLQHIKANRKGKYDCLIGISGGVDSSYVAHLAYKWKLTPLVVHFDNGWNSELAVSNINKILDKTGFDLQTYVIDWEEFKDLQRSFIKASVVDIEMLTDHAIVASMYRLAKENNIKCILSGTNYATEHGLPSAWVWQKVDLKNIQHIHKLFGRQPLKTFPTIGIYKSFLYKILHKLDFLEPLNIINYKKLEAMEVLEKEYGWRYYGGKHYESWFTKFYQAYILPQKFNIDKRKSHLSALIRNEEITLEQAREELAKPLYTVEDLTQEKEFILKKLEFTPEEFEEIMQAAPKRHDEYETSIHLRKKLSSLKEKFNF